MNTVETHRGFESLKDKLKKLKYSFSVRSLFMIIFGILLFATNIILFGFSIVQAFETRSILDIIMFFVFGMIGIIASAILIFLLTIELSLPPKKSGNFIIFNKNKSNIGIESEAKERKKHLAFVIITFIILFAIGVGVLSYYIGNKVKYSKYPTVTATVIEFVNTGDGSKCKYRYEVDGTTYVKVGHIESSGGAQAYVGDKVELKYNPENPNEIIVKTENMFFLLFASFFIYFAFIIVVIEIETKLEKKGKSRPKLMLAYILLGLSAICFLAAFSIKSYPDFISYFADNLWLFFVMMFTNVGLLELFGEIVWLGYKQKN